MNKLTDLEFYANVNGQPRREYRFLRDARTLNSVSKDTLQKAYRLIYDRLAEYEDLEERGLLHKLPCKVGEYVYVIAEKHSQYGSRCTVGRECELFELDTEDDCPFTQDVCKRFYEGCPKVVIPVKVETFEMFEGKICPCTSHYEGNMEIENYYVNKEEAEKALAEMMNSQEKP